MNREEFLTTAQFTYYVNEEDSREVFELLDFNVKKMVVEFHLKNNHHLLEHELEFLAINCSNDELKKYYDILIDNGEDLESSVFVFLSDEQIYMWYELLFKSHFEDDCLEDWREYYEKDYNLFKSKVRDKKIDSILL